MNNFDSFTITLLDKSSLDVQELNISDSKQAHDTADRLRKFLYSTHDVFLSGKKTVDTLYDNDGEFLEDIEESEDLIF